MAEETRNIGVDVKQPKTRCTNDKNCPFHGERVVRGRMLVGTVIGAKTRRSAIIEIERKIYMKKFERFEKRKTRIMVHNPECIGAVENDKVKVMETRKMSKMKSFVIIEKE